MNNNNLNEAVKYFLVFLVVSLAFIGGFGLGELDFLGKSDQNRTPGYVVSGEKKGEYDTVDVDILWEVWSKIEQEHIDPNISGQNLLDGAIKGLVSGVGDDYTSYISPSETAEYFGSQRGEYEGIGATLEARDGYVIIASPITGGPAEKTGLQAEDIILEVDGEDVEGKSIGYVASILRGPADTEVKVAIYRPTAQETLEFDITRAQIDIDNITVEFLEGNIAHVKISRFTEESPQAFNSLWDSAVEKVLASGSQQVIVDLRNNPGGYVVSVQYVVAEFLNKGEVIFKEEDNRGNVETYKVNRNGKLTDVKLVVLVNQGSASASEIFAGAMQDNDRAEVVGMNTFGKGVEQKVLELSNGGILQVVFQKWLTPDGRNINQDEPIVPDYVIEQPAEQLDRAIELLRN